MISPAFNPRKRRGVLAVAACLTLGFAIGPLSISGPGVAAAQSSFGSSNAPGPAPKPQPAPQPAPAPKPQDPAPQPQPLPKMPKLPPVQQPEQPQQPPQGPPQIVEKITKVPIFSREENIEWHEVTGQKIYAEGEAFQFLERPGKSHQVPGLRTPGWVHTARWDGSSKRTANSSSSQPGIVAAKATSSASKTPRAGTM